MLLGCHLSIAGGVHNALLLAKRYGISTVAMFVRNQRQWRAGPLSETQVEIFKRTRSELGISPVIAHGSYLVNLAGSGPFLKLSQQAMADELDRCERLGIEYLVIHPGSSGDADRGIKKIVRALNTIVAACPRGRTMVLLESTAGQGSCLGGEFGQLAAMLEGLRPRLRFGVCLDTCHMFAMGYDIRTSESYQAAMAEFDRVVGLDRLHVVHLNDSKRELGSRVDRHAHIGQGLIGLSGIANVINDPRLANIPKILETPHGLSPDGQDLDEMNLATVRSLRQKT